MAATVRTARRVLGAALAALLALGVFASPSSAIITYQTISGAAECPPGGLECTATFGGNRLATTTPIVVQTGHRPSFGPGLPVSLLTGATGDVGTSGEQGFRFRVIDQNGVVASTTTQSFYHASVPFSDASRAAGSAVVQTDGSGIGTVRFPSPLASAPLAVIVTGRSPYIGPGLPVNLITSGYSAVGFTVRALDQAGTPIANRSFRLHYWATNQAATPNTRAGQAVVTPDERGNVFISWAMLTAGLPPVSVVLTGMAPRSGPNMPVNLLAVTAYSTGIFTRVLNQAGQPITTPVRIAFYATKQPASEL